MALEHAARIQRAAVTDGGESLLRHGAAVVEDPLAEADTQQPRNDVLERGACKHPVDLWKHQLPIAFVPPEVGVIDRAELWAQAPESRNSAFEQNEVDEAEEQDDDELHPHRFG